MINKSIPVKIILGLILSLCFLPASAQENADADADKDRQYVTDQLRLSLYEQPNSQSKAIKLLQSGDELIIDEIRGAYALVTEPDGARGWVKRGFLVTSPTATILLQEEQDKNAELTAEIDKLANSKAVIETYEKDMNAMAEEMEALKVTQQQAAETIASLQQEVAERELELERKLQNSEPPIEVLTETFLAYWQIIVPVLLLLLLLCFLFSKAIIEARIKSRFHGIKIW